MSTIRISNLSVPGFDLLSDEESYLNEINNDEFDLTHGGATPAIAASILAVSGAVGVSIAVSKEVKKFHDRREGFTSFL
ncbi:MAG: hypothetical protein RM049_05705 [Nostoc sp. DedQUE04]|uniref:hypothetical protein n=1 Tax=Nostoc sp. DedQUE04 TaxID=3075390 RepID=UPI002AD39EE5|nr:hypothetical protein [Nostoc sp. DedQUE04]MDZ8134786.1 hypothetical protein [Nostoc sp. DedQUE04]